MQLIDSRRTIGDHCRDVQAIMASVARGLLAKLGIAWRGRNGGRAVYLRIGRVHVQWVVAPKHCGDTVKLIAVTPKAKPTPRVACVDVPIAELAKRAPRRKRAA